MDLNIREYSILLVLVIFTVSLGIYPSIITDGLNYISQGLNYTLDSINNITVFNANNSGSVSLSLNTDSTQPVNGPVKTYQRFHGILNTPSPPPVPRGTPAFIPQPELKIQYTDFTIVRQNNTNIVTSMSSNISCPDRSVQYVNVPRNLKFCQVTENFPHLLNQQ